MILLDHRIIYTGVVIFVALATSKPKRPWLLSCLVASIIITLIWKH